MAIFHLSGKAIGRGKGRSVSAAAAYRSGTALDDDRQGVRFDYGQRTDVAHSEIFVPTDAPAWALDRGQLWNNAEAREDKSTRRATATVAREFELSLPCELSPSQRLAAAREFARHMVDRYGCAVDMSLHAPHDWGDQRNHHAHFLCSDRVISPKGFTDKIRELNIANGGKVEILAIRREWEAIANRHLEAAGYEARIDHRCHKDRPGFDDVEPTVHEGHVAREMERDGNVSDLGEINRDITGRNAERGRLKEELAEVQAQIIDLGAEREKRAHDKAVRAEAKTLDPDRILAGLTERRSTFTRYDINRALKEFLPDGRARAAFTDEVLSRAVPLRESAPAPVSRYSTREVLASEQHVIDTVAAMAQTRHHAVSAAGIAEALDRNPILDAEQRKALDHATRAEGGGFVLIQGQAGTGKSTVMGAVREAYEADGFRVLGTSWTNAVVEDMKATGMAASTMAAELLRQSSGRGQQWDSRTVLLIDETNMVATKHIGAFVAAANTAGAKIVAVYDDKQLGSIERGGIMPVLAKQHEPARLTKVYRNIGQADAFNAMHRGDFRGAVAIFDKAGAIKWSADTEAAKAAVVAEWTKQTAADPTAEPLVLAATNAEVQDLSSRLRAVRKERGELGEDHTFETTTGKQVFATGDRVMFGASGRTKADREAGFYNGSRGTIAGIDGGHMTVVLDRPDRHGNERQVTFEVGTAPGQYGAVKHNLASTVYKSEGRNAGNVIAYHSDQWRSSATSYIALSRHKNEVSIHVAEKAPPWMQADGGLDQLTDAQRQQAATSYAAWAEAKPDAARRYGLADYVAYVQERVAEEGKLSPLDRLADQMGKVEERRSASEFVQGARPAPAAQPSTVSDDLEPAAEETTKRRKPHLSIILGTVTEAIAAYWEHVYNPVKDWVHWYAEDLRQRAADRRGRSFATGEVFDAEGAGSHHGHEIPGMAELGPVRAETLREQLPSGLDDRDGRRGDDDLRLEPPAGPGGYDVLQRLQAGTDDPAEEVISDAGDRVESAADYVSRRVREAKEEVTDRREGPDRSDDPNRDRGRSFGRE